MSEILENDEQSWWKLPLQFETVNPDTLERKTIFTLQRWKLLVIFLGFILLIIAGTGLLIGFTPFRKLLPGDYSELDVPQMIQLRNKVDEMEKMVVQQDQYITTLRGLLSGQPIESLQHENTVIDHATDTPVQPVDKSPEELQLRETMAREDRLRSLRNNIRQNGSVSGNEHDLTTLMPPVIGPIGKGYDPSVSHYGIDILAPESTAIKSIADGMVIQADWNVETGNTIIVLHAGGMISAYKHNSSLLKEKYEKVTQGEAIAIIGNTGTLTTGPHVHFELWLDGFPVDPAKYINFQ